MTEPTKNSADFVTAFATGWPEDKPDLLIAKTLKNTATQLAT